MGLTITATFEEQGIYFAGETLECHVRFANVDSAQRPFGNSRTLSASQHRQQAMHIGLRHNANANGHSFSPRNPAGRLPFQRVVSGISNGEQRTFGETAHFPGLDGNSECSASSSAFRRPADTRRYSTVAPTRDYNGAGSTSNNNHEKVLTTVRRSSRIGEIDSPNGTNGTQKQASKVGLAIFPTLGEAPPVPSNLPPQSDTHRIYRGSIGAYSRRMPQERQSSASYQILPASIKGRASTTASPMADGANYQPRQSISSVLSTPSMSFASWFPFSSQSQQQQQQQQRSSYPSPVAAPASEGGSSGLLNSLWRNLSGGSNLPSRPATRAGSVVEESTDVESLAIGFAEISGSLALASSYIKPDQMELLLAHKGTDYRTNRVIGSPPIGGGLGGRTPTGSSNTASGRSQKTLPLVMSLPTVLFSELVLGPGESQTFSIRVQLPKLLPPSFRGKTARISYDLVVVAKKSMLESTAYVVRIPFRVLAYVGGSGFTSAFPLARPLQMAPDHIKLAYQDEIAVCTPRNASPSFSSDKDEILQLGSGSKPDSLGIEFLSPLADLGVSKEKEDIGGAFEQLKQSPFLQSLIESIDSETTADPQVVPSMELFSPNDDHQDGVSSHTSADNRGSDSKHNIQTACRKRAPVSFSLSKDGHSVASIWLPKRFYQLGDMVSGKLEINHAHFSVYQVSIWLESVETISTGFSNYTPGRTEELTRRIYSEHHEFCRSTQTLGFSLMAPQAAATAVAASFSSSIFSNIWQLRIELIIGTTGSSQTSDYALSAATLFPPVKGHHASSSPHGSTLQSPVQGAPSVLSDDGQMLSPKQHRMFAADTLLSTAGHQSPIIQNNSYRTRSSTIVGSGSDRVPGTAHHYQQQQQRQTLHPVGLKEKQSPARASTDTHQYATTVRQRFDAVSRIPTQTLSCTVAIQMHPSPSKIPPVAHKDTYSVDMTMQKR